MIVAAEATGELDAILDQLARYLERAEATSRRIRQAMLYPAHRAVSRRRASSPS